MKKYGENELAVAVQSVSTRDLSIENVREEVWAVTHAQPLELPTLDRVSWTIYLARMSGEPTLWPLEHALKDPLWLSGETLRRNGIKCPRKRFFDIRECDDFGCARLRVCSGTVATLIKAKSALSNLAPSLASQTLRERLEALIEQLEAKANAGFKEAGL